MLPKTLGLETSIIATLAAKAFNVKKELEIGIAKNIIDQTIAAQLSDHNKVDIFKFSEDRNATVEQPLYSISVKLPPLKINRIFAMALIESYGEKTLNRDETMIVEVQISFDLSTAFIHLTPVR